MHAGPVSPRPAARGRGRRGPSRSAAGSAGGSSARLAKDVEQAWHRTSSISRKRFQVVWLTGLFGACSTSGIAGGLSSMSHTHKGEPWGHKLCLKELYKDRDTRGKALELDAARPRKQCRVTKCSEFFRSLLCCWCTNDTKHHKQLEDPVSVLVCLEMLF